MENKIKEVIIVEGKNDENKLKSIFPNVTTYRTNGLGVSKTDIKNIQKFCDECGIILFLDPDGPGEKIRKHIQDNVKGEIKHCFIDKSKASTTKKVGIEHAHRDDIIKSLENMVTYVCQNNDFDIDMSLLIELKLAGDPNAKSNREALCKQLGISYCNAKRLLKRLELLNYNSKLLGKTINNCK